MRSSVSIYNVVIGILLALGLLGAPIVGAVAQDAFQVGLSKPGIYKNIINVKFVEGSKIRLQNGTLVSIAGADLQALYSLLTQYPVKGIARIFDEPEDELDKEKRALEEQARQERMPAHFQSLPDLNLFFRVFLGAEDGSEKLVTALNALPIVENAEFYVHPELAQVQEQTKFAPLAVPNLYDFTTYQGYRGFAPVGIDALYGNSFPGGRGEGIRIIDIEGSWNLGHQDLPTVFYQNGTFSRDPRFIEHGTAVLGVLVGRDDGIGVTGIVPQASIGVVTQGGFHEPRIRLAASKLRPGDIILLELQMWSPVGPAVACSEADNYIPVEYLLSNRAAILYTVAKGINVVEAAGNGCNNLDDPIYQNRLSRNLDSGAILVGAGAPPPGTSYGQNPNDGSYSCSGDFGPDRSRLDFSNFGSRVDLQGWGQLVTTTGYGDLYTAGGRNRPYTCSFSGTSSASAIVAGAVAILQGIAKRLRGTPLNPFLARQILVNTGTPQTDCLDECDPDRPVTQNIGPRPNLRAAIPLIATAPVACNTHTEGFESGNFGNCPWYTFGDAEWYVTSSDKNTGSWSARAGPISHCRTEGNSCVPGESRLSVTLNVQSGNISFARKVSSEANKDWLEFYIDGGDSQSRPQGKWAGSVPWSRVSFSVTAGVHVFTWVYKKTNASGSVGEDTAWIDDIIFPGVKAVGDEIGVWRSSNQQFLLDLDGDGSWNASVDLQLGPFGQSSDIPLTGDWNGDGRDKIGTWRPSTATFYLDMNGNGRWESNIDKLCGPFGEPTDKPIRGDWDGDSKDEVGLFRPSNGLWYLDLNDNCALDGPEIDKVLGPFDSTGGYAVVGDWNGDKVDEIGLFKPSGTKGQFQLDLNGNGQWDEPPVDKEFLFGNAIDIPIVGDWSGDGRDKVGTFKRSTRRFSLDFNGNYQWDTPADKLLGPFGLGTDSPLAGNWGGTSSPTEVLLFKQDFEDGALGWSFTSFWHVQSDPQTVTNIYNGVCVDLPGGSQLPQAVSGNKVLWYGQASDGSFVGPNPNTGTAGCTSAAPNEGEAISPLIDLSGFYYPVLEFQVWFEIESVDAHAFDLMIVQALDASTNQILGTFQLNPSTNPNGPPQLPFTSAGLNAPGIWVKQRLNLGAAADKKIRLKWIFQTRDALYNGFRGWLIDDVTVLNSPAAAASASAMSASVRFIPANRTLGSLTINAVQVLGVPLERNRGTRFRVEGQNVKDIRIHIFDLSGRNVFDSAWQNNDLIWRGHNSNGEYLANGVYLYVVRVRGFNEEVYVSEVRKLVILR